MKISDFPVHRRDLLKTAGAFGLARTLQGTLEAQSARPRALPARGEFVIRNTYLLTMDERLGDIKTGDIHVRNGEIVAVGPKLAGGGTEIDGSRFIAMPGFVDTHQHMAGAFFRGLNGDTADNNYFAVGAKVGTLSTPDDIYQGVRLALLSALNAGIATVNDLSHAVFTPAHAESQVKAHREMGVRSRISMTLQDTGKPALTFDQIVAAKKKLASDGESGLHAVGVYLGVDVKSGAYRKEFAQARERGLPISVDGGNSASIRALAKDQMLGPDLLLIHCLDTTKEDRKALVDSKTAYSSSPMTELTSLGIPAIGDMWADGVLCSFSVDAPASQDSNMFNVLRGGLGIVRQVQKNDKFTFREALQIGTTGGAKALQLWDKVGSLTPGKRADLILVKRHSLSTAIGSNFWVHRALHTAQTEDVDTVVVDGRILKRGGKFVAADGDAILAEAGRAVDAMVARSGFLTVPRHR